MTQSPEEEWNVYISVSTLVFDDRSPPQEPGQLQTGPQHLDTTLEISCTLAKLVALLRCQQNRVKLIGEGLGRDYTMVSKWLKAAENEIESLGRGSVAIARVLKNRRY